MDDFTRTVGERSLTKLYDGATTLISKGPGMRNVIQLKSVLTAMDLVLEPLSRANMDYRLTIANVKIRSWKQNNI